MKVAIRVDASLETGSGHVVRCLTLARMLDERGAKTIFLCREQPGNLCERIESEGFTVSRLACRGSVALHDGWEKDATASREALKEAETQPDLLVVDHYGLDARWERALRPRARRLLVIDDLADRVHDCDVLLDPNLHDSPDLRYRGLVGEFTRVFVGPRYALLRPQFDPVLARFRDGGLKYLLVFFGGADSSNEAVKVVQALRALGRAAPQADIVLGPINPNTAHVREAAEGLDGIDILGSTDDMASLMAKADLGIGACGGAAWERCILGLPTLVAITAANQSDDARILHSLGAVRNLGDAEAITAERWAREISLLQRDPSALLAMSRAAVSVMMGHRQAMQELEAALVQ